MSIGTHDYLLCVVYQNRSKIGSLELLEAWAGDRGVELVLAVNRSDAVCDEFADDLVSIPFEAPEETVGRLEDYVRRRGRPPLGVLGFGEDEIPLVNTLAVRFGLPGNPESSSVVSRSKREMRAVLRRAGLPEPRVNHRLGPYVLDFFWPELNLVVEADSLTYHRNAIQQTKDLRRDQAHARAGRQRIRFSHYQIAYEPDYVVETLAVVVRRSASTARAAR
jgi:very-short-patch-repair endonuclease